MFVLDGEVHRAFGVCIEASGLNTPVILGIVWIARAVYGRNVRHDLNAFWIAAGGDFPD
jgi:hypothetical protein